MNQLDGFRIVVTGGAGFIGSHLVDSLLSRRRPVRVTVVDNLVNGSAANLSRWTNDPRLRLTVADVRDRPAIDSAFEGADVVFHLACLGVRHSLHAPAENHDVNAGGSLTVGMAARDARVGLLVHVSSSEVFGTARYVPMDESHPTRPETVYGGGKLAGESYARAMHRTYGLPTVVVRPFNAYGPRSHFEGDSGEIIPRTIVRLLAGEAPVLYGDGGQTRDFMHVEDAVSGLIALAECPDAVGETVNLGTGEEVSMRSVCRMLSEAVGLHDVEPEFLPARPGDVRRLSVDYSKASSLTGWTPRWDLDAGLVDLVDWFRDDGRDPQEMISKVARTNWSGSVMPV